MKKTLFLAVAVLISAGLCASERKITTVTEVTGTAKVTTTVTEYTVYDIIGHQDIAANSLLGWGIGSMAAGAAMVYNESETVRAFGTQNIIWGGVDTAIGIWLKTQIESKKANDPIEEAKWFRDLLGFNFFLDIAYMAAGSAMMIWGDDAVRGHGIGVLTQGTFLLFFDGVNYMVSRNLGEKYGQD